MSKTHSQDDLIELSKLRWHCRRGVKELDVVLTSFLEKHYLNSSLDIKVAFKELLKIEDPILMDLVMGYEKIEDPAQNIVLDTIKQPFTS